MRLEFLSVSTVKTQTATYVYDHPASFVPIARLDNLHYSMASEGETTPTTTNTAAHAANDDHWPSGVNVYHLQTDQIGTPRELTSHSGYIAWQAEYRTWGNTLTCEWLEVQEASPEAQRIEQNLRFQGQYFDHETGLHYNRFRYYDPDVGRFVCQDPIGLMGGNNIYVYAPNPTGWVDPLGLATQQRNSKGKFTSESCDLLGGKDHEKLIEQKLRANNKVTVLGTNVTVVTPIGIRYVDILFKNNATGKIYAGEVKSNSACRNKKQKAKDALIDKGLGTFGKGVDGELFGKTTSGVKSIVIRSIG